MKKISLVLALVVMVSLVFAGTAFTGTVKATGGVEYFEPGYFLNFNVHENKTGTKVWGNVKNRTPDGDWYRAKVTCVKVMDGDTVLFGAEIIATNRDDWGPWVLIKVYDGGSPGSKADQVWGWFLSQSEATTHCTDATTPTGGGPHDVLSGNLVVH